MPNPLIEAVQALLAAVPPLDPDHHERDALCARNGRWGTCVECPRDEHGHAYPERCVHTRRSDHQLPSPMKETAYVQRGLVEDLRKALTHHVETIADLEGQVARRDFTIEHLNQRIMDLTEPSDPTRATELEWLKWFAAYADFGPGEGDVRAAMKRSFMREKGKNLPLGWNLDEDGETSLDRDFTQPGTR